MTLVINKSFRKAALHNAGVFRDRRDSLVCEYSTVQETGRRG